MKIVRATGSFYEIGLAVGEETKDGIRRNIDWRHSFGYGINDEWKKGLPVFLATMEKYAPCVLEEIKGMAKGSGLPEEDILFINSPTLPFGELDITCTNIAFNDVAGPILGKNNDGCDPNRGQSFYGKIAYPDHGIPFIGFAPCGMVAATDGMNAEGLAMGHSSLGSIFQQSLYHPFLKHRIYQAMSRRSTIGKFIRDVTETFCRGKGYVALLIDSSGGMCSMEAPCPLVQIRKPENARGMNVVNCSQLPSLANADARSPEGKANAFARKKLLDELIDSGQKLDLAKMKEMLRHHGLPDICCHGENGDTYKSYTEFSMIFLPRERKILHQWGNPCKGKYQEFAL